MQITSRQLAWAVGLIAAGTVGNVWVVITPGLATVAQEQQSLVDDVRYLRERVDEIHAATVRQETR